MHIRTGHEHFMFDGMPTGYMLQDFWAWNSSDLLNNTLRGALAEFIVASALNSDLEDSFSDAEAMNLHLDKPRNDWDAYDILYPCSSKPDGAKIEVKSCAYLQAWEQPKLSHIQFSVRPTRAWSPAEGYSEEIIRHSDLYVFCLFACKDRDAANPMLLDQWDFFVLPTATLNEKIGAQGTVSLTTLMSLNPIETSYGELAAAVNKVVKELPNAPRCKLSINLSTID